MSKFLTKDELDKLNTKRLLAYKKSLMQVPEEPDFDDDDDSSMNKCNPDWIKQYHLVKSVLSTREHVKK